MQTSLKALERDCAPLIVSQKTLVAETREPYKRGVMLGPAQVFGLSQDSRRRSLIFVCALLVLSIWALLMYRYLRPGEAVTDWQGWRQADTQTIALNMTQPGSSLFYPRVAWGGDGPGYVETELQLYAWLTALLMRAFGPGEWAGQAVSLGSALAAAIALWFHLDRRYGVVAAVFGLLSFLSARAFVQVATVIQPDALSLCGYTIAWAAFVHYRDSGRRRSLVVFTVAGALAMLVKPTAAHLGISTVCLLLVTRRDLLSRKGPWVAWGVILAALAIYLFHARGLYQTYGNTFGILSGGHEGSEKVPGLAQLMSPTLYFKAMKYGVVWGTGVVGALALILIFLQGWGKGSHFALLVGNFAMTITALRYTSEPCGTHYFAPAAVLGAESVAGLACVMFTWKQFPRVKWGALAVMAGLQLAWSVKVRPLLGLRDAQAQEVAATGRELAELASPGDLVVVRAALFDPRIFYVAHVRGWVLSNQHDAPESLAAFTKLGARYFVDPEPGSTSVQLSAWLLKNAQPIAVPSGKIWRLTGTEK